MFDFVSKFKTNSKILLLGLFSGLLLLLLVIFLISSFFRRETPSNYLLSGESPYINLSTARNIDVTANQAFNVPVIIDTGATDIIGVDLMIRFNRDHLTLSNIQPNYSLGSNLKFLPELSNTFDGSKVITEANTGTGVGTFQMSAVSYNGTNNPPPLNQSYTLVTLVFTAKSTFVNTPIDVVYSAGSTVDSNLATNQGADILGQVGNLAVNITAPPNYCQNNNTNRCDGSPAIRQTCTNNSWTNNPCTPGTECTGNGECTAIANYCPTVNANRCNTSGIRQICGLNNLWSDNPCSAGTECTGNGECTAINNYCDPNDPNNGTTPRCSNGTPQSCVNNRWVDQAACSNNQYCENGSCVNYACDTTQNRCQGSTPQVCSSDRKSWVDSTNTVVCGLGQQCQNDTCAPITGWCQNNQEYQCASESQRQICQSNTWTDSPCAFGEKCTGTGTCEKVIGDADGDLKIDGGDLAIWLSNVFNSNPNKAQNGDFNEDGKVNLIDYGLWIINYNP